MRQFPKTNKTGICYPHPCENAEREREGQKAVKRKNAGIERKTKGENLFAIREVVGINSPVFGF